MSDNNPKKPFNASITNPDGSPIRNKDNAQPTPRPPSGVSRPAPNLAPAGTMGIRTGLKQPPERAAEPQQQKPKIQFRPEQTREPKSGLSINEKDNENSFWTDGKIITMPGYTFHAKVYDEPSEHGIGGGKISKLQLSKDSEQVVNYDRGWDMPPKNAEHREALHRIRTGLDDTPQQPFKGFDRDPDKDKGFER